MELEQLPASRRRRLPSRDELRNREPSPAQRPAISGQLPDRQPDGAPAAGPVGSCMPALIRAECDDFARAHADPAPDRRRSTANRQQGQDRVGRHRDKGDPPQVLLGGQQAQAVQGDPGQPRPEMAGTGDQEAEHAVLAQGGLEVVGFAEH
jgi:hypothetical protein